VQKAQVKQGAQGVAGSISPSLLAHDSSLVWAILCAKHCFFFFLVVVELGFELKDLSL
jgi:hypothetical protein